MMDVPLTTWLLFTGAETHHRNSEVVTRFPSGDVHRYTLGDFASRSKRLMNALDALGVGANEVVATLGWNSHRHLEAYFGVPCSGRVLHTLNIRLSAAELVFVMNDAKDRVVLVDPDFLPLLEQVAHQLPHLDHVVVLGPNTFSTSIPGALSYEDLIGAQSAEYDEPTLDERTPAGLCYTSGTTGRPKGVMSTHRSTFLHALAVTSVAGMCVGPGDSVLPQVPMFHGSAWGLPHASVAVGAKLVFYGGALEPEPFVDLLVDEKVTVSAGVPTVWLSVQDEIARRKLTPGSIKHIVSGGSQPPRSLIEHYQAAFGIPIIQAWGMTETSPLASMAWPQERMRSWDDDRVTTAARTQAGLPLPGVRTRIVDEADNLVAFDGESMGRLQVQGPWVTDTYLHGEGRENFTPDGWFNTGDVAIGSLDGYFVIADRTKDLIKSGGEWISSVDMESAIMGITGVVEAAVVAIPDPKWVERPLAYIVLADSTHLDVAAVRNHLEACGFARWQLPERIELIDEIPKTAVGKFDKKLLRSRRKE